MTTNSELITRAKGYLDDVDYLNYRFEVRESHGGVFVQANYFDFDVETPRGQTTRKWLLSPEMTESEIVQTAFKCCLTSAEHRAREDFNYRGYRVFGPHYDVNDLIGLCQVNRNDAGDRKAAK